MNESKYSHYELDQPNIHGNVEKHKRRLYVQKRLKISTRPVIKAKHRGGEPETIG